MQDLQDKRYLFCGRASWLTEPLFILNILAILAILLRFLLFAADASTPRAGISLACDLPRRDIREGA